MRRTTLWVATGALLLVTLAPIWPEGGTPCKQPNVPFSVHNLVTGKLREQCN